MKHTRRRRHLRPRPSRSQVHHELHRARRLLNLFRTEWLLEAQQAQPRQEHLRSVHDRIVELNDQIAARSGQ
jgi:hypothetical protein